jgi:hypothetical protein
MTELTQSLASMPAEAEVSVPAVADEPSDAPSFPELIYAHFDRWRETRKNAVTAATKARYQHARANFQAAHGDIVQAYWCSRVESAVVLTEKKSRLPWGSPRCGFHRESDWATQDWPEVATELHRCDELAVRAKAVLTGVRQRICMNLVMASASHLMSLVDRRPGEADPVANAAALAEERKALARTEAYYREAANGQAQIVYFAGMAFVMLVLAVIAAVWLSLTWAVAVGALIAGAAGAVVSVIQRINSGKFGLDYDVGRPYAFFLGGLRPLIGGAFAMAISFAFTGGLLHLPVADGTASSDRRLALLVVAFLAGFSERWAQDTLSAAMPAMAPQHDTSAPIVATRAPDPTAGAAPGADV